MKVAFIYKFFLPNYGGIEVLMYTIAKELVRRGVNVNVITLHLNGLKKYNVIDSIEVFRVKFKRLLFSQVDIGVDVADLRRVLERADVVHIFSSIPSHILISSLKLCSKLGKICIWQPVFIPNRFIYHQNMVVKIFGDFWDKKILPRLVKYPNILIALTSSEAKYFRKYRSDLQVKVLGECVEEVQVDRDFIDKVLNRYSLSWDSYVLSVGRLTWYKGYDLLIDAWRFIEGEYPWLKLVIIGSDWGYKDMITDRIHKYALKNVIILKNIPKKELHALYEGSFFVTQLSRFETFHRIALEAWSHKKPIIALDLGPATEHVKESVAGILVHDSVEEIVKAFQKLIENPELRRKMGLKGYNVFRSRYSVESYVDKLLDVYRLAKVSK